MSAFYNERDPFAAAWLRNLIAAGEVAPGIVDERCVSDIEPRELAGFAQCHFFAGVGVWSYALRQTGWPDDRPIWTGSCPCQPFSAAGKREGFADERHVWPHWHWLIQQCAPPVILGEQVASKDGLVWLALVSTDLEAAGYAFGASDLCAAGFSGAHIRQRLYFCGLADFDHARLEGRLGMSERADQRAVGPRGLVGGLVNSVRRGTEHGPGQGMGSETTPDGLHGGLQGQRLRPGVEGSLGGLAHGNGRDAGSERLQRSREHGQQPEDGLPLWSADRGREHRSDGGLGTGAPSLGRRAADWLFCRDGKWRPVEPGTFPLADAAPARVGRLRAYGNALDAETAQGFIEAVADCLASISEQKAAA